MKKIIALVGFSLSSLCAMDSIHNAIRTHTIGSKIAQQGYASLNDCEKQHLRKNDGIVTTQDTSALVSALQYNINDMQAVVNFKEMQRDYWKTKACFGELGLFPLPQSQIEQNYNQRCKEEAGPSADECSQMIHQLEDEAVAYSGRTWFTRIAAAIAVGAMIIKNQK